MKRIFASTGIVLALLAMLIVMAIDAPLPVQAARPTFGPPVTYPTNLDELYSLIESRANGWVFTECGSVRTPFFGWQQVKLIQRLAIEDNGAGMLIIDNGDLSAVVAIGGVSYPDTGTLTISEDALFMAAIKAAVTGDVLLCGVDGYPVLYGAGVQGLFDELR